MTSKRKSATPAWACSVGGHLGTCTKESPCAMCRGSQPRSETPVTLPPLRDAIIAEMVAVEETAHAVGFNAGLREALRLIDAREKAIDADIRQLSAPDLLRAYSELHARHTTSIANALAELKAKGKKIGPDAPYGFRVGDDGETMVPNAHEQAVIAEVLRLREGGSSLREISRALWNKKMRARVVPDQKRSPKGRRVGEFDPKQISRIIENNQGVETPKKDE